MMNRTMACCIALIIALLMPAAVKAAEGRITAEDAEIGGVRLGDKADMAKIEAALGPFKEASGLDEKGNEKRGIGRSGAFGPGRHVATFENGSISAYNGSVLSITATGRGAATRRGVGPGSSHRDAIRAYGTPKNQIDSMKSGKNEPFVMIGGERMIYYCDDAYTFELQFTMDSNGTVTKVRAMTIM